MLKTWSENLSQKISETHARHDGVSISLDKAADQFVTLLDEAIENDKAVWIIGNGGSASIISHIAQDFMGKLGLRSQALTDASLLTCISNDFGYENVYARPLGIMGRQGDILIAISSSGNSDNIVKALGQSLDMGMNTVTLSGFDEDNTLFSFEEGLNFHLPSHSYGIVETGHLAILHTVLDHMVEQKNTQQDQNKACAV